MQVVMVEVKGSDFVKWKRHIQPEAGKIFQQKLSGYPLQQDFDEG